MKYGISKVWQIKAKKFADYVRDDYNKGRHIIATLGSAGYTFIEDIKMLCKSLDFIGEVKIKERISKEIRLLQ